MLRQRLKDMDLRITELADYLQLSRPTMYKFIECYDNGEFEQINKKVLKLFNYITENELVGKRSVVNYILNNLVDVKPLGDKQENDTLSLLRKNVLSNPDSKKSRFVKLIAQKNTFDKIIYYLMDIYEISQKKERTPDEESKLEQYEKITEKAFKGE